jgi:1-aminocyclopropane-1-carboxylate deaminase
LHALAYVGKYLGIKTIGIIRGERPEPLIPTLLDMESWGMELRFVSRSDYRLVRNYKGWHSLPNIKPNEYWLPEGGANPLALKGVAEIINEINIPYDALCVACGTGGTLAGLINSVPPHVSVLGFAALKVGLKNDRFLDSDVKSLLKASMQIDCHNWDIIYDYHKGGFAKTDPTLNMFITDFKEKTSIQLEPVYTGKMMYGIYDLIAKGYFKPGQRIIALHTGGLQGNRGYV